MVASHQEPRSKGEEGEEGECFFHTK